MSALTCCEHGIQWHHETRGCGYHGFNEAQRCPCLLTTDEALTRAIEQAEARGAAAVVERVSAALAKQVDGHFPRLEKHATTETGWLSSVCVCGDYAWPCPHVLLEQNRRVRAALTPEERP